jgi:hypothetical protein
MRNLIIPVILCVFSYNVNGQNCTILSKANDITPDKLCSPVHASWNITYTGVMNAGTPVSIRFDWDNGTVETIPANETNPGVFQASSSMTYTSQGDVCNYHPQAFLVVNGVVCTSSAQEQIVTVWDDDDHNGGEMHINPEIYPICVGNGDDVRFRDLTQFNCVPPQERDNPNVNTRWIQWIYGTDNTMTGQAVRIGGRNRTFPYRDNIITLPGPVTGSGVWSDVINVANDKLVGQYFQVTLRNWNYCNPYDDPSSPGPPRDRVNGDHPPVVTTAIILIVDYPNATINPVVPMCANASAVTLHAHDPGGTWSGPGISGDRFYPSSAGPGNHEISYTITNANGCHDDDTAIIRVLPVPDASITPVGILCATDPPVTLTAAVMGGTWSGPGMTGNVFNPGSTGAGNFTIGYTITVNQCTDSDNIILTVATPDATINPVDTLCQNGPPVMLTAHDLGGVWVGDGLTGNSFSPSLAGPGDHMITYDLNKPGCTDKDTIIITVVSVPVVSIDRVGTLYINTAPVKLIAMPTGGTFSGPGITGSDFSPNEAGLGTHVITYTTAVDKFGCFSEDTIHIQVVFPPVPSAYWLPDTSGCTPLTVPFRNLSTAGESFIWDFGDKTYSAEKNPVHTYYIPGNYIVKLLVSNIVGSSSHQGIIRVYQSPAAIFDAYPTNVVNNEQVVVFYNYSTNASTYLWNFGDSATSTELNPWHKFENPGTYSVSLLVSSDAGCKDSTVIKTPILVKWREGFIKYPNVFRWNRSGPTGGFWSEGVSPDMDCVFRPFFENVIDYDLQIFNRWGILIYESHDLHKGWDGYYGTNNLAIQGVYVWKVKGQYADGTYFSTAGDVTFLH